MNTSGSTALRSPRTVTPDHPRRAVDITAGFSMVVFCLALGFQQVAIKSVIVDISSLAQIALRSMFAFVLVAWGLNFTLASHMSVFLYTAPVFAALGLHFLIPGFAAWCVLVSLSGFWCALRCPATGQPLTINLAIGGGVLLVGIVLVARQK